MQEFDLKKYFYRSTLDFLWKVFNGGRGHCISMKKTVILKVDVNPSSHPETLGKTDSERSLNSSFIAASL